MSVTVVLDTSALLAYTKGSIAVGELVSIISDDDDTVLVPAACLAEANRQLPQGQDAVLGVLVGITNVEVASLPAEDAIDVGATARSASGIDLGHAAVEAVRHEAQLATQDGATMSRLLPYDWPIIEV
jgi:rRNA-processing protein FCF1